MGDLGCYLRGAWAIESGACLYQIVDDNLWHYNYPPLLAILMLPLADPPLGADTAGHVPYGVSVGIFYVLNILALLWGTHVLAAALERHSADATLRAQPRFCRRWWALRVWPIAVCMVPIGHTAMRGQVNLLLLALLCGAMAAAVSGRRLRSGCLAALAACLKVLPLYLLVYPAWKRDGRALAGWGAGLAVGLVVLPLIALGPGRMVTEYRDYAYYFFGPLLGVTQDDSRKDELLGVNATDSVTIRTALHNWTHPDRLTRPQTIHPATNWTYRLIGVALTAVVLWPRRGGAAARVLQMAGLVLLMVLLCPVNHMHYYALALPAVMALFAARWEGRATLGIGRGPLVAVALFFGTIAVSLLPGAETLKDLCLPLVGALALWTAVVVDLWKSPTVDAAAEIHLEPVRRAA
jgi:hypothetical protein